MFNKQHLLVNFFVFLLFSSPSLAFEGLLQAAGEVRKDLPSVPEHFALPNWTVYHRTDHLQESLASLLSSCPSAKLLSVHAPTLAHATHKVPLTDPPPDSLRYITISPRLSPSSLANRLIHKPLRVMFVFGETGRDLLTSEIAHRLVERVCAENFTLDLPNVELVLVPLANPNGRRIAEMGRRCERTNANDVDIDRNWPTFWNQPTHVRDEDADHKRVARDAGRVLGVSLGRAAASHQIRPHVQPGSPGTEPFSEPETRALRSIVDRLKPVSYVSVRTGAVALTIPWDCREERLPEEEGGRLVRLAEGVAASHCQRCGIGNLWNLTGRTKCGTAADYLFEEMKVPFVHSWYVYNVPGAARGDCFKRHNPTTREGYERVVNNWSQAVLNFTKAVYNWTTLERSTGVDSAEESAKLLAAEAMAKREEDLAKGLPDPESMEDEHIHEDADGGERLAPEANLRDTDQGNGPSGNGRLFSWMYRNEEHKLGGPAGIEIREPRIGYRAMVATGSFKASVKKAANAKFEPLTGWLGVWIALLMFTVGMVIVKRYVFRRPTRKSRLLGRRPVKNA